MKKFENTINKQRLTEAVTNWIFHNDGYDGGTAGVLAEIPWTNEMGFDFWENDINYKIDEAIGSSLNGCEEWILPKIINFSDCSEEAIEYRKSFQKFVEDKVNHIYEVYQKCIDELNKNNENKPDKKTYTYWWRMEGIAVATESKKFFSTHEECYEDMRQAVNKKVLWNIGYTDFDGLFNDETISIKITANRNKIVCESHSGTYTWTVEKV